MRIVNEPFEFFEQIRKKWKTTAFNVSSFETPKKKMKWDASTTNNNNTETGLSFSRTFRSWIRNAKIERERNFDVTVLRNMITFFLFHLFGTEREKKETFSGSFMLQANKNNVQHFIISTVEFDHRKANRTFDYRRWKRRRQKIRFKNYNYRKILWLVQCSMFMYDVQINAQKFKGIQFIATNDRITFVFLFFSGWFH